MFAIDPFLTSVSAARYDAVALASHHHSVSPSPFLYDSNQLSALANALKETKVELAALHETETNLVDRVWTTRPLASASQVQFLAEKYTGRSVAAKLDDVRAAVQAKGADAIVLTALDDIAWLFNVRGSDVEFNPVVYVVVEYGGVTGTHLLITTASHTLSSASRAVWTRCSASRTRS